MILINCPECGKAIADSILICAYCGCKIDESEILLNNLAARYKLFYDLVSSERDSLMQADIVNEYKLCKALAACYELQDYLANRIAEYDVDL